MGLWVRVVACVSRVGWVCVAGERRGRDAVAWHGEGLGPTDGRADASHVCMHVHENTLQVVDFLKLYDKEPMTKIEKVGGANLQGLVWTCGCVGLLGLRVW